MRQVTAAVIIEDGRLLLCRRPVGDPLAGLWELPGGKVEPGETLRECLERELAEELDMRSRAGEELVRTTYHYQHGSFEMIALQVERLSEYELLVHDAVEWVALADAEAMCLAPADVALVQALIHPILAVD